jgi:hypothetical protein
MQLAELRQVLSDYFSEEEIRTLCFDLSIDYDDLPATGKANKVRELVKYLERRDRIPDLESAVRRQRPNIPWDDTGEPSTAFASSQTKPRGHSTRVRNLKWGLALAAIVVLGVIIAASSGWLPPPRQLPPAVTPLVSSSSSQRGTPAPSAANLERTCIDVYLSDIPLAKQISIEVGESARDLTIPAAERSGSKPIGPLAIRLTQLGQPIGVVKLLVLHQGDAISSFAVGAVVDGQCDPVTGHRNIGRPGAGTTLEDWDALGIPIAGNTYVLRPGWQGDHIEFSLRELQ